MYQLKACLEERGFGSVATYQHGVLRKDPPLAAPGFGRPLWSVSVVAAGT